VPSPALKQVLRLHRLAPIQRQLVLRPAPRPARPLVLLLPRPRRNKPR
jgi:hypothetical protein